MKLLVDTDAFCKLGTAGLLLDTLTVVGVGQADCRRLPALPYMLRRGSLRKRYGDAACDALLPLAQSIHAAPSPGDSSLEPFTSRADIDPGEAQLFALAAEQHLYVISGDKRALRAAAKVAGVPEALNSRVLVIEAALIALVNRLGADEVRRRVSGLASVDTTIRICLSPENTDPLGALQSYFDSISREVRPLALWTP